MNIISNNIEPKMLDLVKSLKGETSGHYALHFQFSALQEHYRSEFQLRIAVNILNDIFRKDEGGIFVGKDADIFVIYFGKDKILLAKAIFQLRYLFVDDPLANNSNGSENEDFCITYDLALQWRPFYRLCSERMEFATQIEVSHITEEVSNNKILTPTRLANIISELGAIEIGYAIRKQSVCAIKKLSNEKENRQNTKAVFHEVYINISHLRKLLTKDCNLASDKWLFKYLTEELDLCVLDLLLDRPKFYLDKPVSLNLNVKTVLSNSFERFCKKIDELVRTSVVVEINIADVFADMNSFLLAKDKLSKLNCRLCLDGVTNDSFIQIDRGTLGFDLVKLQWNADMKGDLESQENIAFTASIKKCGANRIILCRCDSEYAIEYGNALGISLFQGRYTDRVIDPDSIVIN